MKTESHKLSSARCTSAKMVVYGIRTHACTNQRRTLDLDNQTCNWYIFANERWRQQNKVAITRKYNSY